MKFGEMKNGFLYLENYNNIYSFEDGIKDAIHKKSIEKICFL